VESWFLELGGRRLALAPGETVIGRGRDCDLMVDDPTVSRNHALLSISGDRVTLQDLDSSNGTFVGGRRLRGETVLAAGARLRFGRVRGGLGRGGVVPSRDPQERFCVACGDSVPRDATTCPSCGERLTPERRMSRSEAVGVSDVLPVGEALASPARGLDETHPPFPLPWETDVDATVMREAWRRPAPADASEAPEAPDRPQTAEDLSPPRPPADVGEEDEGEDAETELPEPDLRETPLFLPAAGFWRRVAAALIDGAGVAAAGAAAWGVAVATGLATPGWPAWATGLAAALAVWLAVSVVGWTRWGTTPGKRWLDLWVCDLDGRPGIGAGRALGRWLGYLASAVPLGVGFLAAGLGADRRAFHDRLAGTYVARGEGSARRRR